jgi:flavin-dependent dehydrogenase
MTPDYDIIIVGGGPAASAAAIHALQQHISVCIVEREVFPRDRPGETLHPGMEPLLNQLGLLSQIQQANFIRHSGTFVHWDEGVKFQPFNDKLGLDQQDWFGFQAPRRILDQLMINHAEQCGAIVLKKTNAEEIIVDQQRVRGIIVNGKPISAHYVIDATGNWHWLARKLNIPFNYFSKPLVARYGYAQGHCPERDLAPTIIADEQGWTWTAKIAPELYQWTRLHFDADSHDAHWLPEEFKNLEPCGKPRGADVTWRLVDVAAGQGFFITGDAAAVLDPASSHGVMRAVMSGIQAAQLIGHVLAKRCPEQVVLQEYKDWLWEWFFHDIQQLSMMYSKLNSAHFSMN